MIKMNPTKTYEIPYEDGEISFSITWKFPFVTDQVLKDLRKSDKSEKIDNMDIMLMNGIVGIKGFVDDTTNKEIILNDETRPAIYDVVRSIPKYFLEVLTMSMGPTGKNLLAGVIQQSTQNGVTPAALSATESAERPEDVTS